MWWSAQVPAGSSTAHHPHRNICSDGPHCQRLEQTTSGQVQWSPVYFTLGLQQTGWCNEPLPYCWTFSALNITPQDIISGLWSSSRSFSILSLSLHFSSVTNNFAFSYTCHCLASTDKIFTPHSSVALHSYAVTRPETGYLWLIGTKTSLSLASLSSQSPASVPYAYCQPHNLFVVSTLGAHDAFFHLFTV